MSTHARPLADWLAAQSDDALAVLFARRGISAQVSWHDFFDAAESLLEPAAIERFLPRLTRAEAQALLEAPSSRADAGSRADADDLLARTALLRSDGTPYPEVADALATRHLEPAAAEHPVEPSTDIDAAHAAERAFTVVLALADVLLTAAETPLALLSTGALSATERRRLAERSILDDTADLDALISFALDAGLLHASDRTLNLTARGDSWLRLPGIERWAALAESFRTHLAPALRAPGGGWIAPSLWADAHPWDPDWPAVSAGLEHRAALLGLTTASGEPAWARPLRLTGTADVDALRTLLPVEVDRIFLQNDLTAIAPGPLVPAMDLRLRRLAHRESATQASSYRFTAESLTLAFAEGETEASVLAFLDQISLTGVPQPLRYLVAQSAQRHGLIRVATDPDTGRTTVTSSDPHLIDTMGVDQGLRPLGLVREGDHLTTKVGRDTVFWALTDARYPASAVDAEGNDTRALRTRITDTPPLDPSDADERFADLIARLRAAQGADADAAWLDRELENAVRRRAALIVEVGMPDGSTRELTLEVTGLGGGRLRGRDRAADVERTLPVRSIRSTRPAED